MSSLLNKVMWVQRLSDFTPRNIPHRKQYVELVLFWFFCFVFYLGYERSEIRENCLVFCIFIMGTLHLSPLPKLTFILKQNALGRLDVSVHWLSIWLLVSAQIMISWFINLSPTSGSVLTAQSLLGILSLPLSLPLPCSLSLSLCIYLYLYHLYLSSISISISIYTYLSICISISIYKSQNKKINLKKRVVIPAEVMRSCNAQENVLRTIKVYLNVRSYHCHHHITSIPITLSPLPPCALNSGIKMRNAYRSWWLLIGGINLPFSKCEWFVAHTFFCTLQLLRTLSRVDHLPLLQHQRPFWFLWLPLSLLQWVFWIIKCLWGIDWEF